MVTAQHVVSGIGKPNPLGPSQTLTGWNFSVFAPDATAVALCLFCADTEEELFSLPFLARTGDYWHLAVDGLPDGTLYLLKVEGPSLPEQGLTFDGSHLLIDPYVRQLNRPLVFNERLWAAKSHFMLAKGMLNRHAFEWHNDVAPCIDREKTIIYEAHVKGMTAMHPDVPPELRGTYLGMAHPSVVRHLKELGVTTIQLLPVTAFMTEPRLEKLKLHNYWGYNPIAFFAPDPRYQVDDAVLEFKQLVKAYHAAGLEVILDVVFNHSAEADCYNLSFRGLANRHYYLFESHADVTNYQQYCNYSGCGNTLNLAQPVVQRLVLDALRYWVTEMHVDGFRFDLAVTLCREYKRFNPHAAFLQIVAQDPVLSQVKMIAEPWDVGPWGYQLGQFPASWSELNDKSRDSFRAYWRGDHGTLAEFATRLLGSRDIFQKHHKPASCSVNYLAYHDGFTLHDLVCYQHKHNWLNAEQNRDGHDHNLSVNYGVEGPTSNEAIIAKRYQHKRNLVATLLLSQGIVHWLGGDELSRTQQGNNNAYCQDNELSYVHWELDYQQTQFLNFVQQMMLIRRQYPCLQQLSLLDDAYQLHGDKHQVSWWNADATPKRDEDWHDGSVLYAICRIHSEPAQPDLLLITNAAGSDLTMQLPPGRWHCIVDTSVAMGLVSPVPYEQAEFCQHAASLSLWLQEPFATDITEQ